MSKTSELIKKSQSKRGAPGTLKRKVKGKMTLSKARALKNKPGATTLDKKQAPSHGSEVNCECRPQAEYRLL